ncbi:MAG: hypothetical protein HYR66_18610 [Sphingobacteriales bacterium]|nr:hypothetical protein [Sphingobacteriales bacterium]MBI3720561.1 hypothetical protein [Sphingobacteriales bacterium]
MNKFLLLFVLLTSTVNVFCQDIDLKADSKKSTDKLPVLQFSGMRVINQYSTELVQKGMLEFRVVHNFDDIAGSRGGARSFFGLDNSTDVQIGFAYGISDKFNVIASRAKGWGGLTQLWHAGVRWKILEQYENDNTHPIALSFYANTVLSTMQKTGEPGFENSFTSFGNRMSHVVQLTAGRKIGKVSVQLSPTFVRRNLVLEGDDKNMFALGAALRIPIKSNFHILIDYIQPFRSQKSKDFFQSDNALVKYKFYAPLGIGAEIETAGHIFHLNFTNAEATFENQLIPFTVKSWGRGEFRWGFNLSRLFSLKKRHH